MNQNSYFLHIVIFSIASTFGLVMILFTMSRIIRHFYSRRNYLSRNPPILFDIRGGSRFSDDHEGLASGHHIWVIPTTTALGLQQSTIDSITIVEYRKDEGLIEGTECLICLGEFQEGESLRLLPKCTHSFHVTCIDTWLRSHNNCPMCRALIVHDIGSNSSIDGGLELVRTIDHDSIPRFSSENEEPQMENLVVEVENFHVGESESSGVRVCDDDSCVLCCEDAGDSVTIQDRNLTNSEMMNFHSSISIGNTVSSSREFQEEIVQVQPMNRLVSVDSSCDSIIMFHDVVDSNSDEESTDNNFGEKRVSSSKDFATARQGRESSISTIHSVSSIGHALQKRHFSLRSSSIHRRRKFMFSRRCRSQSSILPL